MISRRSFLTLCGASGLWVGVYGCKDKSKPKTSVDSKPQTKAVGSELAPPQPSGDHELSAWIHIADNDVVTFFVPEAEMGQGTHTAVAAILAAELGADFARVRATHAPLDEKSFGRQSTGGSTSIRMGFDSFRRAAATARALLIAAASAALKIEASKLRAQGSRIGADGGASMRFGELVAAAAEIELDGAAELRADFELPGARKDGRAVQRRLDAYDKVKGRARYGIDAEVEGMLVAQVAHPPSFGATVKTVDDAEARAVAGVRDVVQIATGVAVLGDHYWAAHRGRDALSVSWSEPNTGLSSASIGAAMRKAIDRGKVFVEQGSVTSMLGRGKVVEADYEVPYLAHAPMEPLSCTARVSDGMCEVWTSTQSPSNIAAVAADIAGVDPSRVVVNSLYLGGGFGRRSQTDYVAEAVHIAKKTGKTVKLVWDREDDIRGGFYRPAGLNRMRAVVDAQGGLLAWEHRIASPSIVKQFGPLADGIDRTSVDGTVKYAPSALRITYADVDVPISTWFWRSVGHSQNGFVTEAFCDEVARAAGKDPVEFRLASAISRADDSGVQASPRLRKVLEIAADKSGWGRPAGEGIARGVAIAESFGSYVAQVAEVSIDAGQIRVHRVVCVIDCGQTVNVDTIEAQMDSGIVYGLSAALYGDLRIAEGRVEQGNFDSYRILRLREMPKVEVHVVSSKEPHGGVGEPGTPPIAGAVANAVFALTGAPVRKLPIVVPT